MTHRQATLNDCALLAELKHQLIHDGGAEVEMKLWIHFFVII
jgi:hypothetical protein